MEAVYVVIGGGIAGVSCIEALSILDENSPIILISASPFVKAVTHVSPLTKMLAEYSIEEKPSDHISSMFPAVTVVIDSVVGIDPTERTVVTSTNQVVKYEKLCICSGASPKVIAADNDYVFGIRDIDSAKQLEEKLKDAKRVVVVGNGGIATELMYEMEGVEIVWVIKDKHISATFIDPGAAEFFQDSLGQSKDAAETVVKTLKYTVGDGEGSKYSGAALGPHWHDRIHLISKHNASKISVEYEAEVRDMNYSGTDGENWPVYVELTNGKIIGCDFVVSATGVVPNSQSISVENDAFDLAEDKGIRVNSLMETNLPNIYAAGDVCSASWPLTRHWFQMRLWTQARQMGSYAARCMVESARGEQTIMDFCFELFTHVTRFFGYKVILLGLFNAQSLGQNYELLLRVTKKNEYVKLVISEGKVQGAVLIGDTDLEEMCENLILNQLDVSEFGEDLLNPNIDIEDYFD